MRVRILLVALAVGAAALGGCQKVTFEKSYTMGGMEYQELTFDPPRYDQKVTVTVSPSKGPVSAWLIKADAVNKVKPAIERDKDAPADVIFGKQVSKTKEELKFEATVPAKTEYMLLIRNGPENNEVSVKVVGR